MTMLRQISDLMVVAAIVAFTFMAVGCGGGEEQPDGSDEKSESKVDRFDREAVIAALDDAMAKETDSELIMTLEKMRQSVNDGGAYLVLHKSTITTLPPEIGKLTYLTNLNLEQNQLTALPNEIWQLTKLESLDLSENSLTELPAGVSKLMKLKILNLSDNQVIAIPAEIGKLTNLKKLYQIGRASCRERV